MLFLLYFCSTCIRVIDVLKAERGQGSTRHPNKKVEKNNREESEKQRHDRSANLGQYVSGDHPTCVCVCVCIHTSCTYIPIYIHMSVVGITSVLCMRVCTYMRLDKCTHSHAQNPFNARPYVYVSDILAIFLLLFYFLSLPVVSKKKKNRKTAGKSIHVSNNRILISFVSFRRTTARLACGVC